MVLTHARRATGIERCIQNCEEAHDVGLGLVDYCLKKGGEYADPQTIKILEDSSEIARTAANFMLRGSDRQTTFCRGCAAICEEAARRLEQRPEDEMFRWGVENFRKCAQSCVAVGKTSDFRLQTPGISVPSTQFSDPSPSLGPTEN